MWGALLGEIMSETAAVWQWLMDREVEAPERYSAVQSYRAAMAVLRQQQHFLEVGGTESGSSHHHHTPVLGRRATPNPQLNRNSTPPHPRPPNPQTPKPQDLLQSGMIDDLERSAMMAPIEGQERALELTGPVWRAPGLKAVLTQLPFLRGQPAAVSYGVVGGVCVVLILVWMSVDAMRAVSDLSQLTHPPHPPTPQVTQYIVKYGHLKMMSTGDVIPEDGNVYVVQSGIVAVTYHPLLGEVQEYYLGTGAVYNLYTALTGGSGWGGGGVRGGE